MNRPYCQQHWSKWSCSCITTSTEIKFIIGWNFLSSLYDLQKVGCIIRNKEILCIMSIHRLSCRVPTSPSHFLWIRESKCTFSFPWKRFHSSFSFAHFVFIEFFPSFGLFEDGKGPLLANKKNIPYTVMVEGNVGAGKSTLVDILSR